MKEAPFQKAVKATPDKKDLDHQRELDRQIKLNQQEIDRHDITKKDLKQTQAELSYLKNETNTLKT